MPGVGFNVPTYNPTFWLLQIRWEAFCNKRLFFFFKSLLKMYYDSN